MGYVALAGLFEPGTVVSLYEVPNDGSQARVGGAEPLAGRRVADKGGSVGFDGLEPGQLYIAQGVFRGTPQEVRCRGLSDSDVREIAQPPISDVPVKQGTQESDLVPDAAAKPSAILHVGVPAGLPIGPPTV